MEVIDVAAPASAEDIAQAVERVRAAAKAAYAARVVYDAACQAERDADKVLREAGEEFHRARNALFALVIGPPKEISMWGN